MKPVLIPALDLWASWQREAALNITQAALMPMAAFASMARSATSARGQRTESSEDRPQAWQGGERVTSISGFRRGEQDRSSSGEAAPRGTQDADANLMRKALEEGCEALHAAAASFIAASKSVSEEFKRSADRHIAASDQAVEALLKAASESSERFAAVAHQAAESLREAVVGLSEASKELSRVAREAGEALKKDAKSAADEIPQAGTNSDKAAARGGDGSRKKRPRQGRGLLARIKRPPAQVRSFGRASRALIGPQPRSAHVRSGSAEPARSQTWSCAPLLWDRRGVVVGKKPTPVSLDEREAKAVARAQLHSTCSQLVDANQDHLGPEPRSRAGSLKALVPPPISVHLRPS
jgi:hypothetical protein